ncbi:hypothetical protein PAMP_021545 [Pampus punctatissimus]
MGGHKVLQKCWQEAKYTSSSNTLYVVLLIDSWPSLPYRGFYGRYQAFGPPVVYNPQEGFTEGDKESEASHELLDFNEFGPVTAGEQMESDLQEHPSPANSDLVYDDYDQPAAKTARLPWEASDIETEVDENYHVASENYSHVYPVTAVPTLPASTQGTFRSGRDAAQTPSPPSSGPAVHHASPQEQHDSPSHHPKPSPHTTTAVRTNAEVASTLPEEAAVPDDASLQRRFADGSGRAEQGENGTEVSVASNQHPSASKAPEPEETEQTHPHPNMVEPLSDHRRDLNVRNHSEIPHLPGDHLFEVTVEVNFSQDLEESWDDLARSLLMSVKALISEKLEFLHTPMSMSSKRIKRLSAGVLYILWLQIGQGPGSPRVHRTVHSALQDLIATVLGGKREKAVIISLSTADVNECGTQMVLCDVNADCVNHFGSYSCHCKPDFQDVSRLGSGGTVCVDVKIKFTGCSSGLSAETKGVYVLFFLLCSLILMLLVAAGMLYHRHHQGAFLVRCLSSVSPPDPNNNSSSSNNNNNHYYQYDSYSSPADSDLPPPPPPARGPRVGWPKVKEHRPAMDLPLLRFSPLLPPDGYVEPQEGGKM